MVCVCACVLTSSRSRLPCRMSQSLHSCGSNTEGHAELVAQHRDGHVHNRHVPQHPRDKVPPVCTHRPSGDLLCVWTVFKWPPCKIYTRSKKTDFKGQVILFSRDPFLAGSSSVYFKNRIQYHKKNKRRQKRSNILSKISFQDHEYCSFLNQVKCI